MKVILVLSAVVAAALAAPTKDGSNFAYGVRRSKKSTYGAPSYGIGSSYGSSAGSSYGAPCAHGNVGVNYAASAPIPLFLAPQGGAHYRDDDDIEGEKSEASPAARSSYGGGYGGGAGVAGAVGVFPNARLGGCAVPLLLSCAPSVVSGHVVKQHYGGYDAPAYKDTEGKDAPEHSWAHAQRTSDSQGDLRLQHEQQHEQKQKKL